MNTRAKRPTDATFPRTGTIHFNGTHAAIWEDFDDAHGDSYETRETRRREHLGGVEAAFHKLVGHLRARGFKVERDRQIHKTDGVVGRKGDLEFDAHFGGRHAEFNFWQNVVNVENQNGGRFDFDKLRRMPRATRLRCVAEITRLIRAMQALGYTYGPKSDLSEPLARSVLRKAEGRELEGLSPLERFNRTWEASRFERGADGWPVDREIGEHNRKDRDGARLSNGDVRYFRHHDGRLGRGHVFTNMNSMWAVVYPDGSPLAHVSSGELFSTGRPDLLPRRVERETQVSRLSRELAAVRALQARILGNPGAVARVRLPDGLGWLAPILWAAAVVTSANRVAVLERVLARVAAGERGYYILSRQERDRGDASLTFFRQNAAGYTWALEGAGRFQEGEIKREPSYYDNEESTVAVPCEAVEKLAGANGCVRNTSANVRAILRAAGEARGARGQASVKAQRKAARVARKAPQATVAVA